MNLRHIKNGVFILGIGAALTWSGAVRAQSGDALLNKLIEKGVLTQREANKLREDMDKESAQTVEANNKIKVASWIDQMKWSGDLRLRSEYLGFENHINGKDSMGNWKAGNPDRLRFRYRLRLGMEANFVDWATLNVRLSSGEAAPGDPVSVNQSFNDTFKKKPINIDVASITLQPPSWDWIKIICGKMDIPIWQPKFNSPMAYDFDVTPEGIAEQIAFKFGDREQYKLFGNFGQFALKEFSKDSNDAYLFDLQGGAEAKFGSDMKNPRLRLTGAGGVFITQNAARTNSTLLGDSPNLGNAVGIWGNTTNFLADFTVAYFRSEAAWLISDKPFLGTPSLFTVSGEYDKNIADVYDKLKGSQFGAVSNLNQTVGWTIQAQFGEAKKKGQWQVAYQYKYLEADAVWDAITDSDWGNGGTDRKGHVVKVAYNPLDWWQLGFTGFVTEKISNRPNSGHNTQGVNGQDELRIQVDSVFKF